MDYKKLYWVETGLYLAFVVLWYILSYQNWGGDYADTDNYFHALRLTDAINKKKWAEFVFSYSNYPFGEVLHWTRALDVVWFVLALPFMGKAPLHMAVFYGGLFLAPLFLLLAVWHFLKALRPLTGWPYRLIAAVLIAMQANVIRVCVFNRPDHHVAFVFFSAYLLYRAVRFSFNREQREITAAAVMAAISLWMAAEGILLYFVFAAWLFAGYCFLGFKYAAFKRFLAVFAIGVSVFYAINPPEQGYLFMDNGRISLFYAAAAWWAVIAAFLAEKVETPKYRALALILFAFALAMVYGMAGWLVSPLDERIISSFVNRISEMESGSVYTMAYPVAGVVFGGWLFYQKPRDAAFIYLYLSLIFFGAATFWGERFCPYSGSYAAIILALFAYKRKVMGKRIWGWILLFLAIEYVSFIIQALYFKPKKIPALTVPAKEFVRLPRGAVVSDVFLAPYIMWYGIRPTVASPYHRNVEGIVDNHEILFSTDEKKVAELIRKHHVRAIFLPKGLGDEYYIAPKANCDKLYGKILGCKNYPTWLRVINDTDYFMYEVDYGKLP